MDFKSSLPLQPLYNYEPYFEKSYFLHEVHIFATLQSTSCRLFTVIVHAKSLRCQFSVPTVSSHFP